MKKKLSTFLMFAVVFGTTTSLLALSSNITKIGLAEHAEHSGYHYTELSAESQLPGCKEYWVCCECHEHFLSKPAGEFADNGVAPARIYDSSDTRYIEPTYALDFDLHRSYTWGNWTTSGQGGSVNNHEMWWNDHMTTDIYVSPTQDVKVSADVTVTEGSFHLAAGVANPADPGQGWYSLIIDSGNAVRLASENVGSLGGDVTKHVYQLPTGSVSSVHNYAYEIKATGEMFVYFDDALVLKAVDQTYSGGYLDFAAFACVGTFSNVKYKIKDAATNHYTRDTLSLIDPTEFNTAGYNWGNWSWTNNSVTATNTDYGNVFSMLTIHQESTQNLVFEADVDTQYNSFDLVWGIDAINDPGAGWYAFGISGEFKWAQSFAENKSGSTMAYDNSVALNETQYYGDKQAKAKLRVVALANGQFSLYLDDVLIRSVNDPIFHGGYIGFVTFYGNGTASNIKVSLTEA